MTGSCLRYSKKDRQEHEAVPHCGFREERSHLAPLAEEPDVIDPSCLGTLRRREEQRYGGHIGKFRGPEKRCKLRSARSRR